MIELLAPAGDSEKLDQVILYGADAVYLGLHQFNLRAAGGNFSLADLPGVVAKAHEQGVRVYVTLNSLARDKDFVDLKEAIKGLVSANVDAIIVSDPGVLSLVKKLAPTIAIHISTQASVLNRYTAKFWYDQGAKRIILARELSLSDIKSLRAGLPDDLELEAFVHGAMCMSYSGRCLLSDYYNSRSANRGACTQPCRWNYRVEPIALVEQGHPDRPLVLDQDTNGSYLLSSSDLCMIEHIPELFAAGITSFKIEGRTKSAFYAATVVKTYREAIDSYLADPDGYQFNPQWLNRLEETVHRHFDTGFYFQDTGKPLAQQEAKIHASKTLYREARVVAEVRGHLADRFLVLEQKNKLVKGDQVDLVMPKGEMVSLTMDHILNLDQEELLATPHARMLYLIPYKDPETVPVGSYLRQLTS